MSMQSQIEQKLLKGVTPQHLEVLNESHMHNVPPGSESHFKAVIVADAFEGLTLVRRHQTVNGILAEELRDHIHALALQTLTPAEWVERHGAIPDSPLCMGGSAAEKSG